MIKSFHAPRLYIAFLTEHQWIPSESTLDYLINGYKTVFSIKKKTFKWQVISRESLPLLLEFQWLQCIPFYEFTIIYLT